MFLRIKGDIKLQRRAHTVQICFIDPWKLSDISPQSIFIFFIRWIALSTWIRTDAIVWLSLTSAFVNFQTVFENICSFFPGATFLWFSKRVHLFLEQTWIFQEVPSVRRTDMNFPRGSICSSNRHKFSRRAYRKDIFWRRFYLFVKQTLLSHRTVINFPKNRYLVLEHIQIFQEPLFSHRTDTHFPGAPYASNT